MLKYSDIKQNKDINTYITHADDTLAELGFTEHSFSHVGKVAEDAAYILSTLGYPEREVELVKIAAHMHDIGNLVNRIEHSQSGAIIAFRILDKMGMEADELAKVVIAIGNHDEGTGVPVNAIAAALIIADKCDVRRSRVRNRDVTNFDIHDRVNFSVTESRLFIDENKENITLSITIDTTYSPVMDYFEIFLERMLLCRRAAEKLGLRFRLVINEQQII
ncbi:MAG: HD domain-containing protein [Ruminococcaceae bacterium]|nr:HD domain-containing protein [Oscillospiraceae bacterium]